MKPKAFVVMPFRPDYERVYSSVVAPELERHGFIPVRADQIIGSSNIGDDIANGIREAALVVVEASDLNANVYFEFGFAVATGKEFLLIAKSGTEIPFDTRRWRHLLYDPGDLTRFGSDFSNWVQNTSAFASETFAHNSRLNRGELFPNIVDACVFIEASYVPLQNRILDEIRSGSMLSCGHAYFTDSGSVHWLRLCNDPLYTVYQDSVRLLKRESPRILACIGDQFVRQSPDFVSLGPGNGQKDRVFLKALFQCLKRQNIESQLYYYPFDISQNIISNAVHTVCNDGELRPQIRVKAMVADFGRLQHFRPVYDYRPAPNIFALLGNTLGNVSQEVNFLQRLKAAMVSGDILLLEVRSKSGLMKAGGQDEDQFGLSFAPLSRFGIQLDVSKIHIREETSVSQIRGSITQAVHYRDVSIGNEHFSDVFLSCVNYYDPVEIKQVLEGTTLDFQVLDVVEGELMVLLVVRKR